jgi:hypothetical protein
MSPRVLLIIAGVLGIQAGALAQQPQTLEIAQSEASLAVQRLAPQLVAFAGSQANFLSLTNGLSQGMVVTLVTLTPDGFTQTATFAPVGTLPPIDVARTLETARQQLISRGIAAPTAAQLGTTLAGGALPTVLGAVQVTGLVAVAPLTPAATASTGSSVAPVGTGTDTSIAASTASNGLRVETRPTVPPAATATTGTTPAATTTPPRFTSESPFTRNTSDSPFTRNTSEVPIPAAGTAATGASTPAASPNGSPSPAVQFQNRR